MRHILSGVPVFQYTQLYRSLLWGLVVRGWLIWIISVAYKSHDALSSHSPALYLSPSQSFLSLEH